MPWRDSYAKQPSLPNTSGVRLPPDSSSAASCIRRRLLDNVLAIPEWHGRGFAIQIAARVLSRCPKRHSHGIASQNCGSTQMFREHFPEKAGAEYGDVRLSRGCGRFPEGNPREFLFADRIDSSFPRISHQESPRKPLA